MQKNLLSEQLTVYYSPLHFRKVKDMRDITPKKIPMGTRENKVQSSAKLHKHTAQNFIISFISSVLSSVSYMNFKLCFRHLVMLEMIISFENMSKTVSLSFQYNVNNLGTKFCSLVTPQLIEGNGYESQRRPLLYVIGLFFALDPAQNTIVVYSVPRN